MWLYLRFTFSYRDGEYQTTMSKILFAEARGQGFGFAPAADEGDVPRRAGEGRGQGFAVAFALA